MSAHNDHLKWRNLKTGLLFLVGLALASWLGFYIGKNTGLLTKHRYINLFVTDIKGLTEGNLVSISGKKVGVVKTMEFTSQHDTDGVLVTLDIRDEFFRLISQDSKATIKSLGVLGDKYLDIKLGHDKTRLADGGSIALANEAGIEDLTASAVKTMQNFSELTDKLNHGEGTLGKLITSDELNNKLTLVTGNLASLSSQLTHGNGIAPQLLNNGELAQDIGRTMKNLNDLSLRLNSNDGSAGKLLVGEPLLAKLNSIADRTDTLLSTMSLATKSFQSYGVGGPGGNQFYSNVNESIASLHKTIGSLDSLFIDLRQNPKRYLHFSVF